MKLINLIFFLTFSFFLFGQDYEKVFSFGENGEAKIDFNGWGERSSKGLRDSLGNFYIGGSSIPYNSFGEDAFSIVKILPNGSKDTTFGIGGQFTLDLHPGDSESPEFHDMAFQPDGKIVFVGTFYKPYTFVNAFVCRVTSDGKLDSTFNSVGYRIQNTAIDDVFHSVAVQSDMKIIVGGKSNSTFIYRFNEDGSYDNTFGVSGKYTTSFGGFITQILISDTDELYFGGSKHTQNQTGFLLFKLTTQGTLDASFGDNGIFNPSIYPPITHGLTHFKFDSDDGFVCMGNGSNIIVQPDTIQIMLFKVTIDGFLDTISVPNVYSYFSHPDYLIYGTDFFLRDNGSLLLAGLSFRNDSFTYNSYSDEVAFFCEFDSNFNLNTNLGENGFQIYDYSPPMQYFKSKIDLIFEEADSSVVLLGFLNENTVSDFYAVKKKKCFKTYSTIDTVGLTYLTINNETFSQSGTYIQSIANSADCDSIITINLTLTLPVQGSYDVSVCDSFTWLDGITYYSSNDTSTFLLTDVNGNDSLIILNLTILEPTYGIDTIFACTPDTVIWIDGQGYTENNNTATFVLTNANGCDSIVTLNLIFNQVLLIDYTVSTCDSLTWIDGITYFESTNDPVFFNPNSNECGVLENLNLTLNHSSTEYQTVNSCTPYTWIDGNTYYYTDSATVFYTSVFGCDSIIKLYVDIYQPVTIIDDTTVCDFFTNAYGYVYYESINGVNDLLQSVYGCDSIVTYNITINHSSSSTDTIFSCTPITWIDGITYTESNTTATHTLQTVTGCDSVVSLHLTITNPQPISTNVYVQPSHPDSCVGNLALHVQGNELFEVYIDDIMAESNVSDYSLFSDLCSGVHTLKITDVCGDSLVSSFVIPVDSNYIFTNPFLDSIAVDSLGTTVENCEIDYNSIDTAYIDSLWATGNTVYVIWNIVDANGSNYDTTAYELNNGNGVYYLQLSLFCPNRALGEYFTVSQAIHFSDGNPSTVSVDDLEDVGVSIYPNPTSSSVTIQLSGQNAQVKLYDAHGKFIREQTIISSGELSLVDVQSGIYLIEIISDLNRSMHKVIKQ